MLPELKIQPLRYVLAIVDEGGFHAAARRLHRTQPAVSMAVRELEQRLGEPLFEKGSKATLTPFGSYCLPRFRELIGLQSEALAINPQDWLAVINQYGGDIAETYGVPVPEIVEGIQYGVRKVNIDTDLRMAATGAIRQFIYDEKNAAVFDPRKFLKAATDAMQAICEARYQAFGSAGHAGKIKPLPLSAMVKRYA